MNASAPNEPAPAFAVLVEPFPIREARWELLREAQWSLRQWERRRDPADLARLLGALEELAAVMRGTG